MSDDDAIREHAEEALEHGYIGDYSRASFVDLLKAHAKLRERLNALLLKELEARQTITKLNTQLEARVQEINFLQRQAEAVCALKDIKYEQWHHFCDAIPQHITLWVDRCPHCGMPRD